MSKFWKFLKNEATETIPESIELRIEGDIVDDDEAWVYEWFGETSASPNAFKEELSQYKGKDITVWIDSYGGSVFAAAGIYNALKEHNGKITAKIDSKAMSAASVIAMAADELLMSPVAILMIHNPLTFAYGNMHDLRKTADILDTVKESIINAYVNKTGRSRTKISQMMDSETYMSANVAVKEGFADAVMYQNSGDPLLEGVQNFAFDRLAVVNSSNQSIKRAIELFRDKEPLQITAQSSPSFTVGDRVEVALETPHMEGHVAGEVKEAVLTWTYGIVFDGMEDMGVHKWYVESELKSEEQPSEDENSEEMMEDKKKKKQHEMPGMESDNTIELEKIMMELDLI